MQRTIDRVKRRVASAGSGEAWVRNVRRPARALLSFMLFTAMMVSCDDDDNGNGTREPVVFNIRYVAVTITAPLEGSKVTEISFSGDDLKEYTYGPLQTGSRRINCSSSTCIDNDDQVTAESENSVSYASDADVIFDVVDLNDNITRFTPSTTGAITTAVHNAAKLLDAEERADYATDLTRRVNKMPNDIFEIR